MSHALAGGTKLAEFDEKDKQAQRAVKAFRSLQPTLTAYARVLTRRQDVSVVMAARDNGSTDGKRIFFRPPLALGDGTPHNRHLCDKRGTDMQLLCPACRVRETVLVPIYHEIAHICFDSFEKPMESDKKKLIHQAIGLLPEHLRDKVSERFAAHRFDSFMELASKFNQFLPTLVNALEDARINAAQFKARKGTKLMFDADVTRVFTEGVEQKDAEGNTVVKSWKDYPQNSQLLVGVFCKASGYDYSDWFIPPVVEALNDHELSTLVNQINTVRSAKGVYELAIPVLLRCRELGFCQDVEEMPQPEGPSEEESEEEGKDGKETTGNRDDPSESDSDDSGDPSGDPSSGKESDESTGDSGSESADPPEDQDTGSSGSEPSDSDSSDGPESGGDVDAEPSEGSSEGGTENEGSESEGEDSSSDPEASDSADGEADGSDFSSESGDQSSDDSDGRQEGNSSDLSEDGEPEGGDSGAEDAKVGDGLDASSSKGSSEDSGISEESSDQEANGDGGSDSRGQAGGPNTPGTGVAEVPSTSGVDQGNSLDEPVNSDSSNDLHADGSDSDGRRQSNDRLESAGSDDSDSSQDSRESELAGISESSPGSGKSPVKPDELIDTGADEGEGGTQVHEHESWDDVPMGDGEDAEKGLSAWNHHGEKPTDIAEAERKAEESTVDRAIIQGIYFETPSRSIFGVREHRYNAPVIVSGRNMSTAWDMYDSYAEALGVKGEYGSTPESVLGNVLLKMRVAFSENKRGAMIRHKKSGKVDASVLGKRAWNADERLFRQKILPGKRDYFVLIGLDVSGSTLGTNIDLIKRAAFAQATLLHRMGIKFSIYAHSGNYHDPGLGRGNGFDLDVYIVKEADEVWDKYTQERLTRLGPAAANLDGHSMEYYRKRLDERIESDKILLYFSDGKMPAENYEEELLILQREIKNCRIKNYHLLGVGIRTDSPRRHGLDTVQVDRVEDLKLVIEQLGKYLAVSK